MAGAELITVCDAQGHPTGAKTYAEVHRNGDWHLLVFVLAARIDRGQRLMLLQLRSASGDPYRGHADVIAGGHVRASERTETAAARELYEEVRIKVGTQDLLPLGTRPLQDPSGICKRVFEHFYLCTTTVSLDEVGFSDEVGAVLEVDLDDFDALLEGRRQNVAAPARLAAAHSKVQAMELTRAHIAGYSLIVLDTFRRCVRSTRKYLDTGVVDRSIWD